MNIYNEFEKCLKNDTKGHNIEIFGDLITHLFEKGVIVREDSIVEKEMYDYFVDMKNYIEDYLAIIRVQVYHNEDQQSVRIFAPSSRSPIEIDGTEHNNNFTLRLSSDESAYLIALAIIYDQKIRSGNVLDDYSVEVEIEEFTTSLVTNLGYELNDNKTETKNALKTLKKLRVVNFADDVFENADSILIVRPFIKDLVRDSMIEPYIQNTEEIDYEN